jgi:ectoine hydroxylase-related dioxygenase (phytanoyl-CoA dioxygenase family)
MMNKEDREHLDRDGYLVLENFMGEPLLAALRERVAQLFQIEGQQAGAEFKQEEQTRRLANLVDKGEVFEQVIALSEILELVGHILGPEFKLSSLNVRSANPHSTWVQPLHADMGALPDDKGYWVANTVWMLDDFTTENGAIRMIPGSQKWGRLPQDALGDPMAPHSQSDRQAAVRNAWFLRALGQAAAAISEAAAASGGSRKDESPVAQDSGAGRSEE